jgi:hypothetical protein
LTNCYLRLINDGKPAKVSYVIEPIDGKEAACVGELVQAEVLVLEDVHAVQGVVEHQAEKHAHGPSVHADEHLLFFGPRQD